MRSRADRENSFVEEQGSVKAPNGARRSATKRSRERGQDRPPKQNPQRGRRPTTARRTGSVAGTHCDPPRNDREEDRDHSETAGDSTLGRRVLDAVEDHECHQQGQQHNNQDAEPAVRDSAVKSATKPNHCQQMLTNHTRRDRAADL
jgi:hypothetical protein